MRFFCETICESLGPGVGVCLRDEGGEAQKLASSPLSSERQMNRLNTPWRQITSTAVSQLAQGSNTFMQWTEIEHEASYLLRIN